MLEQVDVAGALDYLARWRPIFRSKADFGESLATVLEGSFKHPSPPGSSRRHVDIRLDGLGSAAIEVRYWTQALQRTVLGEHFNLKNQSAQDHGRYDFWKDVARIESLIDAGWIDTGYVVALTNDRSYWNTGRGGAADEAFRIHEGRLATGTLAWGERAGPSTREGRESPLSIQGRYRTSWDYYSDPAPSERGGEFRYLLLDVGEGLAEGNA